MPGVTHVAEEVKQMIKEMLNFPQDSRVRFTSGGSESLYSSIVAAKIWAKKEKKIVKPEIVVPYSMHAAYSKWCKYTDVKLIRVPVGSDYRADVNKMEDAITKNTILIAGSAPSWPYGRIDDIAALGEIAERRNIWMHVDGCLGGFKNPFVEKLGQPLPIWDFRVPGVRSISADVHKHGYAAKPLSSITFRNKEWEQYFDCQVSDWPDGIYATEGIAGSTSAGPIGSAWAVMKFLGEEGYLALAKRSMEVKKRYIEKTNNIDGIYTVVSDTCTMILRLDKGIDLFAIMGGMFERENYCLPTLQPPSIKLVLDPVPDEAVDFFCQNLSEVIPLVKAGKITIDNLKPWL